MGRRKRLGMADLKEYNIIINELRYFNFSIDSIAFEYLVDAIYLVTKDRKRIKNFNQYVYPKIAKKYKTRSENVLWCISKLINIMYENTNQEVINKYFNTYYRRKLSPKLFIIIISNNIQNNNKPSIRMKC